MKMTQVFSTAVLMAALFLSTSLRATTVRSLNIEELTAQAQAIVKVEVVGKQVEDDPEESGKLVTYYTLKVLDALKGEATVGEEIVIKQIAQGEYSEDGLTYRQNFYFPEYEVGKTYVFFLPNPHQTTGLLAPIGLFQGVFDVISVGGTETLPQLAARQHMLKANLAKGSSGQLTRFLTTATAEPSYENFKNLVQSLTE